MQPPGRSLAHDGDVRIDAMDVASSERAVRDLRDRLRAARWPAAIDGAGWAYGTDPDYLRRLVSYWADGYDFSRHDRLVRPLDHRRATIDDTGVHVVLTQGVGP